MERLTDCAQGYCEMYCKKYGHCFEDPGDCIFKDEIKMYDALKSIEGIVPFDRLLELADADRAGRLVSLPCKVGATVYGHSKAEVSEYKVAVISLATYNWYLRCQNHNSDFWVTDADIGKTVFLTREEAEAAIKEANHA